MTKSSESVGSRAPLLARRVIAWTVYDGPIEGLSESASGTWHLFEMVAWNPDRSLRVMLLTPMSTPEAAIAIRGLAEVEEPRWQEWWVSPRDSAGEALVGRVVRRLRDSAREPSHLVLSRDLLKEPELVCEIGADVALVRRLDQRAEGDEVSQTPFDEWVTFIKERIMRR